MNIIKSIFISLLIPLLIVSCLGIVYCGVQQGITLLLVSAGLINLPFLVFFISAMLFQKKTRTTPHLTNQLVMLGLGGLLFITAIMTGSQALIQQTLNQYLIAIIFSNSILFAIYVLWYSKLNRQQDKLVIGKILPEFVLYQGDTKRSSQSLIERPCVFMFYRGNWCPFCVAQIKELVAAYKKAIHQGVQFVLVSPQPDAHSEKLAKKFDVPFLFLTDKDNSAATQLGILHKNGLPAGLQLLGYDSDTVMPTVIVTDDKGLMTYLSMTENYRIRPQASEFLNYL